MDYTVEITYRGVYMSPVPFLSGIYAFGRGDSFAVRVDHAAQMLGYAGQTPDVPNDNPTAGRLFTLDKLSDFERMKTDGFLSASAEAAQWCTEAAPAPRSVEPPTVVQAEPDPAPVADPVVEPVTATAPDPAPEPAPTPAKKAASKK